MRRRWWSVFGIPIFQCELFSGDIMTDDINPGIANKSTNLASGDLPSEERSKSVTHRWMQRSSATKENQLSLNANQHTSISAMISYISTQSGQSEFRLERILSDRFNIPNPKCLPANDFDEAIRYLADILSA
jgi:hypothetical protein